MLQVKEEQITQGAKLWPAVPLPNSKKKVKRVRREISSWAAEKLTRGKKWQVYFPRGKSQGDTPGEKSSSSCVCRALHTWLSKFTITQRKWTTSRRVNKKSSNIPPLGTAVGDTHTLSCCLPSTPPLLLLMQQREKQYTESCLNDAQCEERRGLFFSLRFKHTHQACIPASKYIWD